MERQWSQKILSNTFSAFDLVKCFNKGYTILDLARLDHLQLFSFRPRSKSLDRHRLRTIRNILLVKLSSFHNPQKISAGITRLHMQPDLHRRTG